MAWQTIAAPVAGGFASAIAGSIFGGKKGKSPTDADFRRALRDENRQDANIVRYSNVLDDKSRWKSAQINAPKYGIHPLIALGATPYSSSGGGSGIGTYRDGRGSPIPDAIGQAAGQAVLNTRKPVVDQKEQEIHEAQLEEIRSRTALNKANAYRANTFANEQLIDSANNRGAQKSNGVQDADFIQGLPNEKPINQTSKHVPVFRVQRPNGKTYDLPFGTSAQQLEDTVGEGPAMIHSIDVILQKIKRGIKNVHGPQLKAAKRYWENQKKIQNQKIKRRGY